MICSYHATLYCESVSNGLFLGVVDDDVDGADAVMADVSVVAVW